MSQSNNESKEPENAPVHAGCPRHQYGDDAGDDHGNTKDEASTITYCQVSTRYFRDQIAPEVAAKDDSLYVLRPRIGTFLRKTVD